MSLNSLYKSYFFMRQTLKLLASLTPAILAVSGGITQGQALTGRGAGLDCYRLAHGHKILRARDADTSGWGSEHG